MATGASRHSVLWLTKPPARNEWSSRGDPHRVDLGRLLVDDRLHLFEPVAGVHDRQDHPQDLRILDAIDDAETLGLPSLDTIEVVLREPLPSAAAVSTATLDRT